MGFIVPILGIVREVIQRGGGAVAGREFFPSYGCSDRNWEALVVEGALIALQPFYQESDSS